MKVSVERHPADGFTLSTLYRGYYIKKRYIGYRIGEAKADFKQFAKSRV